MYKYAKRFFDIVIALIALIASAWLLLPCMLILWCSGEHEIWYLQKRMGWKNRIFHIIKFVTMLKNSPNMVGGTITTRRDPRVLPFGRFLRMTKLNELPQVFNVLNGTMSIVGPRPLVEAGFELYLPEIKEHIYAVHPGITGLGSVVFRDEEKYLSQADDAPRFYREKIMPYKGALEMYYQEHISLWLDLKIIFLTAWLIAFPDNKQLIRHWIKDLPQAPEWLS